MTSGRFISAVALLLVVLPAVVFAGRHRLPDETPAIVAARAAVKANPRSVDLRLALAHACWDLGTIEGRREADDVFEAALRRWPNERRLVLDWAELNMERRFYSRARGLFRRALKTVPDSEPALLGLARLALYEFRRYLSPKALREADKRLDQLLAAHPDHTEGMAASAFTRLMRADTLAAAARADDLVRRHPDDSRGHLLRLLLALDAGRWDDASDAAERGVACLSSREEIEAYRSLERINWLLEDRREVLADSGRVTLETDFWKRRDPTPATVMNERRLEHIRRVFLADLLYGIPQIGLRGWNTEPGEAIIRFGAPVSRRVTLGAQILSSFRAERLVQVHQVEGVERTFQFDDQFLTGNWVEPFHFGLPSLFDDMSAILEGAMPHPIGGPPIDLLLDAVQFRAPGGGTRVELIVAVPEAPDSATAWRRPLALYDRRWGLVAQRGGTFEGAARVADRREPDAAWLVDLVPIVVDPGLDSVRIGSQVEAGRGRGFGGQFDRLLLRTFSADSLEISDIMMLDRIEPEWTSGPFVRRDGGTVPSPDATYLPRESVPVYFEAYNLTPGADGRCRYTLEVEINDLKTFGEWTSKRRSALTANRRPRRPRSSIRFEEWSPTPTIERTLDLSVGSLPRGDYWVRVVIHDLASRRSTQGEGAFRIVNAPGKSGSKRDAAGRTATQ